MKKLRAAFLVVGLACLVVGFWPHVLSRHEPGEDRFSLKLGFESSPCVSYERSETRGSSPAAFQVASSSAFVFTSWSMIPVVAGIVLLTVRRYVKESTA